MSTSDVGVSVESLSYLGEWGGGGGGGQKGNLGRGREDEGVEIKKIEDVKGKYKILLS